MKILALGDTHGRKDWKQIVEEEEWDKVVFIGDYFDTHSTTTAIQQIRNFKDIVAFKKASARPVILLVGNHDFHYLPCAGEDRYSGYQYSYWEMIREVLLEEIDQLQMCHQENGFLFTHAGVTQTWCHNFGIDRDNLCHSINKAFKERPEIFKFYQGDNSNCGEHVAQSPIWVRPGCLTRDRVHGFNQVVGHTRQLKLQLGHVCLIDTIETSGEYLCIEGETATIRKREEV